MEVWNGHRPVKTHTKQTAKSVHTLSSFRNSQQSHSTSLTCLIHISVSSFESARDTYHTCGEVTEDHDNCGRGGRRHHSVAGLGKCRTKHCHPIIQSYSVYVAGKPLALVVLQQPQIFMFLRKHWPAMLQHMLMELKKFSTCSWGYFMGKNMHILSC